MSEDNSEDRNADSSAGLITIDTILNSFDEAAQYQKAEEAAKNYEFGTVRSILSKYDAFVDAIYERQEKLKQALAEGPNPKFEKELEKTNAVIDDDLMDDKWRVYLPRITCRKAMQSLLSPTYGPNEEYSLVSGQGVRCDLADAGIAGIKGLHEEFEVPFNEDYAYGLVYRGMLRHVRNTLVNAIDHGNYMLVEKFESDIVPKLLERIRNPEHPIKYALGEAEALEKLIPYFKADACAFSADNLANELLENTHAKKCLSYDLMESLEYRIKRANELNEDINREAQPFTIDKELYKAAVICLLRTINESPVTEDYIRSFPRWMLNVQKYLSKSGYSLEEKLTINGLIKKSLDKFPEIIRKYRGLLLEQVKKGMNSGDYRAFKRNLKNYRMFCFQYSDVLYGKKKFPTGIDEWVKKQTQRFYDKQLTIMFVNSRLHELVEQAARAGERKNFEELARSLLMFTMKYQDNPSLNQTRINTKVLYEKQAQLYQAFDENLRTLYNLSKDSPSQLQQELAEKCDEIKEELKQVTGSIEQAELNNKPHNAFADVVSFIQEMGEVFVKARDQRLLESD